MTCLNKTKDYEDPPRGDLERRPDCVLRDQVEHEPVI